MHLRLTGLIRKERPILLSKPDGAASEGALFFIHTEVTILLVLCRAFYWLPLQTTARPPAGSQKARYSIQTGHAAPGPGPQISQAASTPPSPAALACPKWTVLGLPSPTRAHTLDPGRQGGWRCGSTTLSLLQ